MRKITGLLLVLIFLSACAPGVGSNGAPQVWIDTPLDGSSLPLATVDVMSHATDPGGILQFELGVNGEVVNTAGAAASGSLIYVRQTWDPPAPGLYILEVRAMNNAGVWSNYAQVLVTIAGEPSAPVLEPSLTPTQTSGPTPTLPPYVLILYTNSYCRAGPGEMYDILATILAGVTNPPTIEGRNQANTWWYLGLPDGSHCWALMLTGTPSGPLREVPVLLDPATPTPSPTAVPTQQGPLGCWEIQPNQSLVCTVPCPPNANPGGACNP